ncbi:MAG TPA: TIGR02147 family protein [Polyangiales bacterium]|nr:TIGR02147 family protein [Polyangiales bacterium]
MQDSAPKLRRCPINVFGYLDYRQFLADFYAARKHQGFSYRVFSRLAGLGAPNYLQLVITGKRNLTPAMAVRFADACGLRADAAAYFQRLVEFNQTTNASEREECYAKLTAFARYRNAQKLELAHAEYHANWYIPAIRELCASPVFVDDPDWIASVLVPHIKPQEARRALEVLLELGLLERTPNGLRQGAAVVSTGPQTRGMHIKRYHAEMMRRATAAMELIPAAQRDVSSLTLCLSADGIEQLKSRIQAFRRELIELAENETRREQAVQVNFQLFPLSVALPARSHARPKVAQRA